MKIIGLKRLILFCLLTSSPLHAQLNIPSFPRPCGIYALGTLSGGASEIRNYSFVDGYVMRKDWTSFETSQSIYNWTTLEQVVKKLDSLGQGLTLDIFRMKVPSYILSNPNTETYSLTVGPQSFTTSAPWDSIANKRFNILLDSVAAHMVFSIAAGMKVPLKNHPVLKQIDASPIGMNGIRDIYNQLTTLPSYNRSKFVKALTNTANAIVTKFPGKFAFVAIFGINDNLSSSQLTKFIRDTLMRVFNRNGNPRLGFFQENLACSTPSVSNNNVLYLMRDSTYTLNQMLQGWQNPFINPAQTNACISASGGPDIGVYYGLTAFKSTYCEVYSVDLDYPNYAGAFNGVHDSIFKYCPGFITGILEKENESCFQVFPNPSTGKFLINNKSAFPLHDIKVYSLRGEIVYSGKLNGFITVLDLTTFSPGIYYLQLDEGPHVKVLKLVLMQ